MAIIIAILVGVIFFLLLKMQDKDSKLEYLEEEDRRNKAYFKEKYERSQQKKLYNIYKKERALINHKSLSKSEKEEFLIRIVERFNFVDQWENENQDEEGRNLYKQLHRKYIKEKEKGIVDSYEARKIAEFTTLLKQKIEENS